MKKSTYNLAITMLIAGSVFTSCESQAQKDEKEKNRIETEQKELNERKIEVNAAAQKVADAEDWKQFKAASELKIKENEIRIDELKLKKSKPGKMLDELYQNRIEALVTRNKELRERIYSYEKNQSDWEVFKREFNHDMDELGKALKDFSVDNKK
jgi:flagellar biosynthesis GTPase FlhF